MALDTSICTGTHLDELYAAIGIAHAGGVYAQRTRKRDQLADYCQTFRAALNKLSTKRPLTLIDCGCGRSYLSFYLNYMLSGEGRTNLRFVCIDRNAELISLCRSAAANLGYANMIFLEGDILDKAHGIEADIVYSLHACDTATDQTIAAGIRTGAKYILSVSCCQHTARAQLRRHSLRAATRFTPYKERMADIVADTMRALLMEAHGYQVDAFEFTPARHTPKNIMLRGVKTGAIASKRALALEEYRGLAALFHVRPLLETYLTDTTHMDFAAL